MLNGNQTWIFSKKPTIISTGVVGGPFEKAGKIKADFDYFFDDQWCNETSFEKAHTALIEKASDFAVSKASIAHTDINFFLHGDLINQITPSSFAAKKLNIPYLGLFSACATSMEGLAIGAMLINSESANYVMTGAASHNSAVEKQFRYPTEYGSQKPNTSQWTATGAGLAILSKNGKGPKITSATIGKVIDYDLHDPFHMGAAMAPAAADTISTHLKERNIKPSEYDLIITGDLAYYGRELCLSLLEEMNISIPQEKFLDCGLELYSSSQPTMAGGSGSACSALVTYGHFINKIKNKELNKILVVATGALLSPLTVQQKQSIPCIAHAVSIENGEV